MRFNSAWIRDKLVPTSDPSLVFLVVVVGATKTEAEVTPLASTPCVTLRLSADNVMFPPLLEIPTMLSTVDTFSAVLAAFLNVKLLTALEPLPITLAAKVPTVFACPKMALSGLDPSA